MKSAEDGLDNKAGETSARKNVGHPMRIGTPTSMSRWRRMTTRPTRAGFDKAISVALFALAAAMLAFYLIVTYRAQFHSDAAMKLMLAEQMAKHFTLFPRDWNYVNDIPIIFPSLVATPFLWFFQPSFPIHALTDMITAGLVLYAAYVAARALGIEGPLRWLVPTLLASGFSRDFAEFVFGQSAYSCTIFILLLLAGWGARYLGESGSRPTSRHDLAAIIALIVISVASGPRGLATYAAPLLLATAGFYVIVGACDLRDRARRFALYIVISTIIGLVIFTLLAQLLRLEPGASRQPFPDTSRIANNLQLLVRNWLELFDALPPAHGRFSVFLAAIFAARLGIALLATFLPLLLLLRLSSIESAKLRFLVLLHASVFASTCYLFVFTGVVVENINGAPRYLLPLIPTALLTIATWLQDVGKSRNTNSTWIGWGMACAMLVLSPLQLVAPAFAKWPAIAGGLRANPSQAVIATLQRIGVHRGYAAYWYASAISVLSGSDVRVAPFIVSDGTLPLAYHGLTSDAWYANDAHGSTFIMLDGMERAALNRPALDALLGTPMDTYRIDGFDVLTYPYDVGERLGYSQPFVRLPMVTAKTCAADFAALDDHLESSPRAFGALHVRATNRSDEPWSQNSIPFFNPALRIVAADGTLKGEPRALLPHSVKPGESVVLTFPFRAPGVGQYKLKFGLVAEGEAWCGDVAANWGEVLLTVKP